MVSGALLATWILLGIRRSNSISGEPGPIDHPEKIKTIFLNFQIRDLLFPRSIFLGSFFRDLRRVYMEQVPINWLRNAPTFRCKRDIFE